MTQAKKKVSWQTNCHFSNLSTMLLIITNSAIHPKTALLNTNKECSVRCVVLESMSRSPVGNKPDFPRRNKRTTERRQTPLWNVPPALAFCAKHVPCSLFPWPRWFAKWFCCYKESFAHVTVLQNVHQHRISAQLRGRHKLIVISSIRWYPCTV